MRAEFCIFESNAPGLKADFYEPYVDMPMCQTALTGFADSGLCIKAAPKSWKIAHIKATALKTRLYGTQKNPLKGFEWKNLKFFTNKNLFNCSIYCHAYAQEVDMRREKNRKSERGDLRKSLFPTQLHGTAAFRLSKKGVLCNAKKKQHFFWRYTTPPCPSSIKSFIPFFYTSKHTGCLWRRLLRSKWQTLPKRTSLGILSCCWPAIWLDNGLPGNPFPVKSCIKAALG